MNLKKSGPVRRLQAKSAFCALAIGSVRDSYYVYASSNLFALLSNTYIDEPLPSLLGKTT